MNPEKYDIWYYDDVEVPIVNGFLHKKVTEDEFEQMEIRLPSTQRIFSKAFYDLGFHAMYVPKEEARIENMIDDYIRHGPLVTISSWMAQDN